MALPVRKGYTGNGVQSSLTSNAAVGATSFTVAAKTGWPATFPFFVVVDPGTAKEEKMRVTGISTLTLTVVRGVDNTTDVEHSSGAVIYPVFTATEADEANQVASAMTTKGDLIATDGSTINRLAVSATNTHVLQVDSTATNGFKWGQVATAGIADLAVTGGKIDDNAVTSAKIAPNTIVQGDVATALLKLVCPVGTISPYAGATAPTGWLLCDGTATTGYTELIDLVGSTTPNLKGKVVVGLDSADADFNTRFETGGVKSVTLTSAQSGVPAHQHTFSGTSNGMSANATLGHSITDPGHNHDIALDGDLSGTGTTALYGLSIDYIVQTGNRTTGISIASHDVSHNHTYSGTVVANTAADAASAHTNLQPYMALNYIIKHDY